jgi:MFS family permease
MAIGVQWCSYCFVSRYTCVSLMPTNKKNSQIVGNLGSGQVADMIGRRNTLIAALVVSFAAITMEFVATTNELFFGGKFLNGFAVGTIQTVATAYIGEVWDMTSKALLARLTLNLRSFPSRFAA